MTTTKQNPLNHEHPPVARQIRSPRATKGGCKKCGSASVTWHQSATSLKWYLCEIFDFGGEAYYSPVDFHSAYCGDAPAKKKEQAARDRNYKKGKGGEDEGKAAFPQAVIYKAKAKAKKPKKLSAPKNPTPAQAAAHFTKAAQNNAKKYAEPTPEISEDEEETTEGDEVVEDIFLHLILMPEEERRDLLAELEAKPLPAKLDRMHEIRLAKISCLRASLGMETAA